MQDRADLYASLRHEFGNSVNSLSITLEVLLKNYELFDDATRIEFIRKSLEQVNKQCRFMDGLRHYCAVDIGDIHRFELVRFLEQWLSAFQAIQSPADIRLSRDFPKRKVRLAADPNALAIVLTNILTNSIEALAEVPEPRIHMACHRDPEGVKIQVSDNGVGISEIDLPKVSGLLFTTKKDRLGLGLAVARKLVSRMGGQFGIESKDGKGTAVTLLFPIAGEA